MSPRGSTENGVIPYAYKRRLAKHGDTLPPYGFDTRGDVWLCPQCRSRLRPSQIHVCLTDSLPFCALVYFVDGKPVYLQ